MKRDSGRIWKISPGEKAKHWKRWQSDGVAAIGFSIDGMIGEIGQYPSLEDLVLAYQEWVRWRPHAMARQLWRFGKEVRVGDLFVAYSLYHLLDVGIVTGECRLEWDELAQTQELYAYRRSVDWLGLDATEVKGEKARSFMKRNLTIFAITDESVFEQVERMMVKGIDSGQVPRKKTVLLDRFLPAGDTEPPKRVSTEVSRIVRDTAKSRALKSLCNHRCQICRSRIFVPARGFYSEVHHIRPLGGGHDGPDVYSNMICFCPMHHAEMDLGVAYIEPSSFKYIHSDSKNQHHGTRLSFHPEHQVEVEHLVYHMDEMCSEWKQ